MNSKLLKTVLFVLVMGLLLTGGGYVGYRSYKSIRQARLNRQATEYLAQKDLRKAQLCLQRAVNYNNRDVETCRLMARLAEAGRSPAALVWLGRVVELNPGSLEDRLALAQAALVYRDLASASSALAGVDNEGKQTAAFHNIAGGVAAASNQPAQAEEHFREAVRLEPSNAFMQLNLAVAQLGLTNKPALDQARTVLGSLASNPTNSSLRCQALRELVVDSLRHQDTATAFRLSGQLLQETNSVFRDRILHLGVLRSAKSDQFSPALTSVQKEAGTNAGALFELGLWQLGNLGPSATLNWLRNLPKETQTNQPAAMFMAECLLANKDWKGLQAGLSQQSWGDLEFYRHAFLTRALRGQGLDGAAKLEWGLAFKAAESQLRSLVMLKQFATQQQWPNETEEILWTIAKRYPAERGAVQELTQIFYVSGRTRPLMALFQQEAKRAPKELPIKNNLAITALLLEASELRPHDLAREVYQNAPTNAAYASTYAFSLHLRSKNAEALEIMQTLSPKALEAPSVAGYYGLILKATGNQEKANTYLKWALKGRLLPEEKKLFERGVL